MAGLPDGKGRMWPAVHEVRDQGRCLHELLTQGA